MSKAPPAKQTPIAAAVKGLRGWVEVFKAGNHTDSKGRRVSFSQGDLDQMISNHALGAAPAVIGHPKDTAPAYAQVDAYKREGDSLFAKFTKINPAFEAGVESGAYYNRSISVAKDPKVGMRVVHVGWLGAVAPAIDGLEQVRFSAADDDNCFEFSAPGYSLVWGLEAAASLMRSMRDRMIEKDGLEVADATLPQYRIDSILESATTARSEFNPVRPTQALFTQPTPTGGTMNFTQADLDAAAAAAETKAKADAATAAAASAATFAANQAELVTLRKERQSERIALLIDGYKAKGLILPAEENGMNEFMASLEDAGVEFTFSKAEGGEAKKTPAQFFADFMAARKPVIKLGPAVVSEGAPQVDGSDPAQLAQEARNFMKAQADKGVIVTLPQAVAHAAASARV